MQKQFYFDSIDILRGFAAISVLVYHVIELYEWTSFPVSGLLSWFRIGWMGVDLFFVISGFVIGLSAFSEIEKRGDAFRNPFIRRRLIRIVPLHYLTMLIFVVLVVPELLFENFWPNLFAHIFFVHNLNVGYHGAINGSNWSLATEMQFYVLMLIIAPWVRFARWWQVALVFIGIAWSWRYGVTVLVKPDEVLGSFPVFIAATQLPGMLDEFAAGLLLARFIKSEKGIRVFSIINCRMGGVGISLLAGFSLFMVLSLYWKFASFWDYPLMVTMFRTLLAFSFMIILIAACVINPPNIFKKILLPFYYLGTISYGIYLWHLPVLLSLRQIQWLTPEKALPYAIGLTIIFAAMSWHFFERPLIKEYSRKKEHS